MPACYIGVDTTCPRITGTRCYALEDYSDSPTKYLRLSQLHVTAPNLLSTGAIPTTVVTPAVTLDLPQCYMNSPGKGGLFNWLIEIDTDAKRLKTGGAAFAQPTDGYCFLDEKIGESQVKPVEVDIDYDPTTGKFATKDKLDLLVVPIYTSPDSTPILLPISNATITGGELSENGNCIGRFKGEPGELEDGTCATLTSDSSSDDAYQWKDGAQLEGTITLEEADKVDVVDLGVSLCKLITNHAGEKVNGIARCLRDADGVIDYSGAKQIEGSGKDAYVTLKAGLAASAVKRSAACQ